MTSSPGFTAIGNIVHQNANQVIIGAYHAPGPVSLKTCLHALDCPDPDEVRTEICRVDVTVPEIIEWIFHNKRFKNWKEKDENVLLWITGSPGKGKSRMAAGITDELLKGISRDDSVTVGYFYCQSSSERLNNAIDVLKGIIYTLSKSTNRLGRHLCDRWNEKEQRFDRKLDSLYSLWTLLGDMINDRHQSATYIVIDALDECDEGLDELLRLISTVGLTFPRKIKWLLTSRPLDLKLESFLRTMNPNRQLTIDLETHRDEMENAAKKYVAARVRQLAASNGYSAKEEENIRRLLLKKADRTFLWVALVCQDIEKLSASDAIVAISSMPTQLTELYGRNMQALRDACRNGVEDARYSWQLIWTLHALFNEPHMFELATLAGLPKEKAENNAYLTKLLRQCNSFLKCPRNTIFFVHKSARDYLDTARSDSSLASVGIQEQRLMASRCLQVLQSKIHRNMFNLNSVSSSVMEIPQTSKDWLDSRIGYSCVYWIRHMAAANPLNSFIDEVQSFLYTHLLHWLEALGSLGRLIQCLGSWWRVTTFFQKSKSRDMLNMARSTQAFIKTNYGMISKWPLQVYCSALVFSPSSGPLVEAYAAKRPEWVLQCLKKDSVWKPLPTRTIESGDAKIIKMLYSPSGNLLATLSESLSFRVWHLKEFDSSTHMQDVRNIVKPADSDRNAPSFQVHLKFVQDETQLEAVIQKSNENRTLYIRRWTCLSGKLLYNKDKKELPFLSFEQKKSFNRHYSDDLRWTADVQIDGSAVTLQHRIMNKPLRNMINLEVPGPPSTNRLCRFSPDSEMFAALEGNSTIRIWSTRSHLELRPIHVEFDYGSQNPPKNVKVESFEFSWDHQFLECRTTRLRSAEEVRSIFNVEDARLLSKVRIARPCKSSPDHWSRAFSSTGTRVAFLNSSEAVIAEIRTGQIIAKITGQNLDFVALSSNPQVTVAASDQTIRIWNLRKDFAEPNSRGNQQEEALASSSQKYRKKEIGPDGYCHFMIPSPQSKVVCFSFRNLAIARLLNMGSGAFLDIPLEDTSPFDEDLQACAFFSDSKWFATAIKKGNIPVIQVWKTPEVQLCPQDLTPPLCVPSEKDTRILAMAFSEDRLTLAYTEVSQSETIRVKICHLMTRKLQSTDYASLPSGNSLFMGARNAICFAPNLKTIAVSVTSSSTMQPLKRPSSWKSSVIVFRDTGFATDKKYRIVSAFDTSIVKMLKFSPLADLLAVASDNGEIKIFDTSNKNNHMSEPIARFTNQGDINLLIFVNNQHIRTNRHILPIYRNTSPSPLADLRIYELFFDGQWICVGEERILWIPPEYRPLKSKKGPGKVSEHRLCDCLYFRGNWAWILHSSSRVLAIQFDMERIIDLLKKKELV